MAPASEVTDVVQSIGASNARLDSDVEDPEADLDFAPRATTLGQQFQEASNAPPGIASASEVDYNEDGTKGDASVEEDLESRHTCSSIATPPPEDIADDQSLSSCAEALVSEWSTGSWLVQFLSRAVTPAPGISLALVVLVRKFPAFADCAIPQLREYILGDRTQSESATLASVDAPDGTRVEGPKLFIRGRAFSYERDAVISTPGSSDGRAPSELSFPSFGVVDDDVDDFGNAGTSIFQVGGASSSTD
eukprot:gnl/MRDRNA2_/MRDRNA2_85982_c0_seq3.p1 gnl/MRDRNA2_/MRDRNA2_85982_c0~~gnl/MRDRNA2_/MRDRNA2_85982_c0_seq3.p1  ORF type:complete len:287 (+),score=61.39 gnl/MRDRNA2_/MRDRNA2_85982_c0_seq3:116-862(+)